MAMPAKVGSSPADWQVAVDNVLKDIDNRKPSKPKMVQIIIYESSVWCFSGGPGELSINALNLVKKN